MESLRFRSVAFANPTSKLPSMTDTDEKSSKPARKGKEKEARQHDRERAASWRASKGDEEDKAKRYLTPKEKKRIAFIKHELHEGVDSMNAYIVFAHSRPTDDAHTSPAMDPYEAARLAAEHCDGTVFMERTLRADIVGKGLGAESNQLGRMDPKTTIFVGNLDFASKEEDLRAYFEGVVSAERGPPQERGSEESEEEEEDEEEDEVKAELARNRRTWVKRVRIIRDMDTQLGKGFAYVQFLVSRLAAT